jgi:hypothetical protein
MASKAIAILQTEIEAKQREVQRLAEEDEKNNIPSLAVAIEEVFRTQDVLDLACGENYIPVSPFCVLGFENIIHIGAVVRNDYAVHHTGKLFGAALNAKYIMYKSLLNNAREDMDWKKANSNMIDLLTVNVSNLQSRLDAIDAEKLKEQHNVKMWKFRTICAFLGAATAWIVHYCLEYPRNDSTVLAVT